MSGHPEVTTDVDRFSYTTLGATKEIGASCHYLHLGGTGVLLDAGMDPEEEGLAAIPRLELLNGRSDAWVDHAFVTHAHHDHLGALPMVIKAFPHVMVHMSRATRSLADLLLPASARLQQRRLREGSSTVEPLFGIEELEAYAYLYLTHELGTPIPLTGLRGRATVEGMLLNAGHVLGAVGVQLRVSVDGKDRSIFYTSDTSTRSQTILRAADYPAEPVDTLLLETTLGADPDAELTTRKTEEKRFGEAIRRTLRRGGSALIPVFALGRGQDVLAMIDRFKQRGLIDEDVPVYTAGLMRAISDVYDKTRFTSPRLDEEFQVYGVSQKRLPRSREAVVRALTEPGLYVIGSGMMFERTASNRLAQEMITSERHSVLLVGYARDDSPARRLLDARADGDEEPTVVLDKVIGFQTLRSDVERFRFSGHAHRRDLIGLVDKLKPRHIVLVHGESRAREWMADNIRFFHPDVAISSPELGEEIPLFID